MANHFDEQNGQDEYNLQDQSAQPAVATATPPGPVQGPGLMTIAPDQWKQNVAGPVDLQGQGLRMSGGGPFVPQGVTPFFSWQQQRQEEKEREQQVERLMAMSQGRSGDIVGKAMELQGRLGFAADIKAGIPVTQALSKWSHLMNSRDVQNQINVQRFMQQQALVNNPQAITTQEVKSPSGELMGTFALGPRGQMFQVKPQQTGPTDQQRLKVLSMRLRDIENDIKAARDLPKKEQEPVMMALRGRREQVYRQINQLGYNRVKHNETGKEFYHQGDPSEIPSTYSIQTGSEPSMQPAVGTESEDEYEQE